MPKCPICNSEYEEGKTRFCTTCRYDLKGDIFLSNVLNSPSPEDLIEYNSGLEVFRSLWVKAEDKTNFSEQATTFQDHQGLVEMIEVVEGGFTMGCNDGDFDERPMHRVRLSSFFIGKYAVTQLLWESVMGNNPSYFEGENRPVEQVDWFDAIEFCNKLSEKEGLEKVYFSGRNTTTCDFNANGYRLPSEAEWEYAARGGNKSKGYKYSGGNDIENVAWVTINSENSSHEVGTKQENELGLYDMSGNIYEWCWDRFGQFGSGSQIDPRGPGSGSDHVLRGGSWISGTGSCRVSHRSKCNPVNKNYFTGFRVVKNKK